MRRVWMLALLVLLHTAASGEDADKLYSTLRSKILAVKDYTADVKMKVDVSYMKIPMLQGKLYFKAPDRMKLERNGGISILPKKNINLTLSNLIPTGQVTVLDAGYASQNGKKLRILKIIPADDQNKIVLSKLWVDEENMLVTRTETTTQNDGTVIMNLEYGKYTAYALPDKVTVYLDLKDYKIPQGMAMDYNDSPKPANAGKNQKGTIEIRYLKYEVNTGLSDNIFNKGS